MDCKTCHHPQADHQPTPPQQLSGACLVTDCDCEGYESNVDLTDIEPRRWRPDVGPATVDGTVGMLNRAMGHTPPAGEEEPLPPIEWTIPPVGPADELDLATYDEVIRRLLEDLCAREEWLLEHQVDIAAELEGLKGRIDGLQVAAGTIDVADLVDAPPVTLEASIPTLDATKVGGFLPESEEDLVVADELATAVEADPPAGFDEAKDQVSEGDQLGIESDDHHGDPADSFWCVCGREFAQERGLSRHVNTEERKGNGADHEALTDVPPNERVCAECVRLEDGLDLAKHRTRAQHFGEVEDDVA